MRERRVPQKGDIWTYGHGRKIWLWDRPQVLYCDAGAEGWIEVGNYDAQGRHKDRQYNLVDYIGHWEPPVKVRTETPRVKKQKLMTFYRNPSWPKCLYWKESGKVMKFEDGIISRTMWHVAELSDRRIFTVLPRSDCRNGA